MGRAITRHKASAIAARLLRSAGFHALLLSGAAIMLAPFAWMISTSLKDYGEVFTVPIRWIPSRLVWSNYVDAWNEAPFARYFFNSAFVASVTTIGQLTFSALAAYAFATMNFFGREIIFTLFLGTMMIPDQMTLVPNYVLLFKLGWIDSYYALIVPWLTSVFAIFLMRQFFQTVPGELYDAAQIDGCTRFGYLWKVMAPLSRPVFITCGLFTFIGSWNAFLWPLIVTNTDRMRTIQVGLSTFMQEHGTVPTLLMAASTMAIMPVLIGFFFVQRQFIQGIARTGLKS